MWNKREICIFITGMQTFHTITHLFIALSGTLPIQFFFITWNQQLNMVGIISNALITLALFWYIHTLKRL